MKTVTIPASLMEWIKVRREDGVIGSKDLLKAIADIEQVQDKMTVEKQPCEGFLPGNFNKTACVECGRSEEEHEKQPAPTPEVHTSCEGCEKNTHPNMEEWLKEHVEKSFGPAKACESCYAWITPFQKRKNYTPKQPAKVLKNCKNCGVLSCDYHGHDAPYCSIWTPQPAEARYSVGEIYELVNCWLIKMHNIGLSPFLNIGHSHFGIKAFITEGAGK